MLAYRASYLSLFSYQTNHIPLIHPGFGQSVLPPAPGAAPPMGQHLAVKWPKTSWEGGLPLSEPNSPAGTPDLRSNAGALPKSRGFDGAGPHQENATFPTSMDNAIDDNATLNGDADRPQDLSGRRMMNEPVAPMVRQRRHGAGEEDVELSVRGEGLERGEQMV